jgi:hypothetical protein
MKNPITITIGVNPITINATYTNELGAQQDGAVIIDNENIPTEVASIIDYITNRLANTEEFPVVEDMVSSVSLSGGQLIIKGKTPPKYKEAMVEDLSDSEILSGTDKTHAEIYEELEAFVLAATGSPLVKMDAPFDTDVLFINGVKYQFSVINGSAGTVLINATKLAKWILNYYVAPII